MSITPFQKITKSKKKKWKHAKNRAYKQKTHPFVFSFERVTEHSLIVKSLLLEEKQAYAILAAIAS
jgi:hypothetical protein